MNINDYVKLIEFYNTKVNLTVEIFFFFNCKLDQFNSNNHFSLMAKDTIIIWLWRNLDTRELIDLFSHSFFLI